MCVLGERVESAQLVSWPSLVRYHTWTVTPLTAEPLRRRLRQRAPSVRHGAELQVHTHTHTRTHARTHARTRARTHARTHAPEIRWSRDDDDDVTVMSHTNLSVSADMLGDNSWTCSTQNELNHGQSATLSIQFTVVAGNMSAMACCENYYYTTSGRASGL